MKRLSWFVCAALLVPGFLHAGEEVKRPVVEVALCLDVSNSMDGLIAAAKQKLWDVVNDMARAKPTPELRVALYSYGNNAYDATAGWVRQEIALTGDLDRVSEKLVALQATKVAGSEEYVARVCRDAVERLDWSANPKALKVIFVCGNEPADQDKEVNLKAVAEAAVRKNIIVNTIYCGGAAHIDAAGWKDFALKSEGRFAAIDQNRPAVAIATPQDRELAELSAKLNETYLFAGKGAKDLAANQRRQDDNALKLGGAAAASRAESKAGELYRFAGQDLVEKAKSDPKFDVKKIATEELPDELKKLTPAEREKHVRDLLTKREALQKQIVELANKRATFLAEEQRKAPAAAAQEFDQAVRGALRDQAKKKGIEVPEKR